MCISNKVGDILISNAVWTGIPMATLLNAAGVKEGAVEVVLHSADGYTDTFAIEKALEPTTLIAIAMNGEELPDKHGFPARVVVPGLFGEKNAKWLTGIEVVDKETKGFYEKQGWGPSFVIPTRALFYVPELKNQFRVGSTLDLRGIAFAGNRGISKVEISLDDGKSWLPTTIDYPGTKLTWALWSYDWRPTAAGEFGMLVRATDGNGELQTAEKRSIVSEGATGYHRVVAKIVA
jgi:DMSO/TMAO reductase YedYZ molybdopterin-dependent catalytic subunit